MSLQASMIHVCFEVVVGCRKLHVDQKFTRRNARKKRCAYLLVRVSPDLPAGVERKSTFVLGALEDLSNGAPRRLGGARHHGPDTLRLQARGNACGIADLTSVCLGDAMIGVWGRSRMKGDRLPQSGPPSLDGNRSGTTSETSCAFAMCQSQLGCCSFFFGLCTLRQSSVFEHP